MRGISKRYGPIQTLEDVSLRLAPGEVLGPVSYTHLTLPTKA